MDPIEDSQKQNEVQLIQNMHINEEDQEDTIIQLQGSLVNKLIKRMFPQKIVTSDFKKQFSKLLSIFILFVQSGQPKKKYGESDILAFLEQEGLGKTAQDLRSKRKTKANQENPRKIQPQMVDIEQVPASLAIL